jgi:LPXTG-site transpeptidase (sortase) family protein
MKKNILVRALFGKLLVVSFFSLIIALIFVSSAFAADGVLEVKSFRMTERVARTEPKDSVIYFYQISNNSDTPVSNINITDDACPNVFYDAVNEDANVDFKLNKGETWSFHCKSTVAEATTGTVTVSGLMDGKPVIARTNSTLRVIPKSAASSDLSDSADAHEIQTDKASGLNFDPVPAGMPNTGLGGAKSERKAFSAQRAKSFKPLKKAVKTVKKSPMESKILRIPAARVSAQIEAVGKAANGTMAVPANANHVGWFSFGVEPGVIGNAVIAGHLDTSASADGVFRNLNNLKAGDDVYVNEGQRGIKHFKVSEVKTYSADNAPLNDIFGPADKARLNLITCAGKWDEKSHQYSHRLVVYSELVN